MSAAYERLQEFSQPRNLLTNWRELSLLDKMRAAAFASSSGAAAMVGLAIALKGEDTASDVFLGGNAAAAIAFAGGEVITRRRNRNARNFSERDNFGTFVETGEYGQKYTSPYPVSVSGVDDEYLGVGVVIGALREDDGYSMPVIAIQDLTTKQGQVEILGSECWMTPLDEELTDILARPRGVNQIVPASQYVKSLDRQRF